MISQIRIKKQKKNLIQLFFLIDVVAQQHHAAVEPTAFDVNALFLVSHKN